MLPAFLFLVLLAGGSYAQTAQDQQKPSFSPEPAPLASADPESLVDYRLVLAKDFWLQPHLFIRGGALSQRTWKGSTETDTYWSRNLYLRNGCISLDAQLSPLFTAFYQSDDLNVDAEYKNGFHPDYKKRSNAAYIKDAYLHFIPAKQFQLYAGLLTVPVNRSNMMSDAGLLGTDNTAMHPEFGSFSRSGRDTGVMMRGLLFSSILEYRFGVFRGLPKETNNDGSTSASSPETVRNRDNNLRYAGRIQLNAIDPEEGYFYSENYLSKKEVFGIGFGMDYQPDIYHTKNDYLSWAIDVPLNINAQGLYMFTSQFNIIYALNYPDFTGKTYKGYFSTNLQCGVLVAERYQPIVKYTYTTTHGDDKSYKTFTTGINYFLDGNRANVKFGFDVPIGKNKHYPDQWKSDLQFQLYL